MNAPKLRFKVFKKDWESYKLGSVSDVTKLAGYEYTKYIVYADSGEIIALRGLNIKNGKINCDTVKYIDNSDFSKLNRSKLFIGDLLFTYVGTIGELAIVDQDDKYYLAPNVCRIRPSNKLVSYFLLTYMQRYEYKEKVIYPLITTSSQPALSMENIREFTLNIPDITEQQKVSNFFTLLDRRIEQQQEKVEAWREYKKGMMQKLFSRELRFKDEDGQEFPEWEVKYLKNIVTFFDGQRKPVSESDRINGIYPYYGASGIVSYVNDYIFEGEYLLLSEDGANIITRNLPIVYRTKGKFWLNNHAHIFKAKKNFSNGFLFHALERINYIPYNSGTAQPKLNLQSVKSIELELPSYKNQMAISGFLNTIDNKIDLELQKMNQLYQQKIAFMQQMFI